MRGIRTMCAAGLKPLGLAVGMWFCTMPCCCCSLLTATAVQAAPQSGSCYVLAVEGMTCETCAKHVQQALQEVSGVTEARVSFKKAEATVCTKRGNAVKVEALIDAVKKAGYKAKMKKQS